MTELITTIPALRIIAQAIIESEKGQLCSSTIEELNKIVKEN